MTQKPPPVAQVALAAQVRPGHRIDHPIRRSRMPRRAVAGASPSRQARRENLPAPTQPRRPRISAVAGPAVPAVPAVSVVGAAEVVVVVAEAEAEAEAEARRRVSRERRRVPARTATSSRIPRHR
jgi:hypothetical protein